VIGFIEGLLAQKQPPHLLVNVNGIGYEIEAPMTVFYDLPETGARIALHTHLQVREDSHRLYGFNTVRQRDLFRSLLKVSGVGPRVALAILSGLNAEEFERCIGDGDIAQLTRVPGIGRKTAERLLVEMRDRLSELPRASGEGLAGETESAEQDAVSALLALGYKPAEAARALRGVRQAGMSSEELIRGALAALARVSA
jgi:Holliday junction DNA helicase RuvA